MTREQKDLLLKDLCARLPYKVKLSHRCNYILKGIHESGLIVINNVATNAITTTDVENTKPYLFPLSSMTDEQKTEEYKLMNSNSYTSTVELPDFYNKNHIDYRGLIPMGLAEDATGKNIY